MSQISNNCLLQRAQWNHFKKLSGNIFGTEKSEDGQWLGLWHDRCIFNSSIGLLKVETSLPSKNWTYFVCTNYKPAIKKKVNHSFFYDANGTDKEIDVKVKE